MTKSEILSALPKLSKTDLEAIHAMAGHLLGAKGRSNAPASPMAALVFDAISAALNSPMKVSHLPQVLIKKLESNSQLLTVHFNNNFSGWDETKNLQIAFLRYMMILLRLDLEGVNVTPSPKNMIINLPRILEVFGNAFPGYLINGLGKLFVQRMKEGRMSVNVKQGQQTKENRKG